MGVGYQSPNGSIFAQRVREGIYDLHLLTYEMRDTVITHLVLVLLPVVRSKADTRFGSRECFHKSLPGLNLCYPNDDACCLIAAYQHLQISAGN
jgi:hypothetical protein